MRGIFRLILVFLVGFIFSGCCSRGDRPGPPYGKPDDTSTYSAGEYQSIGYIYYCYSGEYISIDYASADKCSEWEKVSEYRSSGICDYQFINQLHGTAEENLSVLLQNGFSIDTLFLDSSGHVPGLISITAP